MADFKLRGQVELAFGSKGNISQIAAQIRKELGAAIPINLLINPDKSGDPLQSTKKSVRELKNELANSGKGLTNSWGNIDSSIRRTRSLVRGLNSDISAVSRTLRDQQATISGINKASGSNYAANITKDFNKAANEIKKTVNLFDAFVGGVSTRFAQFAKFAIASAGVQKIVQAIDYGFDALIKISDAQIKLKQVTGAADAQVQSFTSSILRLSREFGVSSTEILKGSDILAQAGFNLKEVQSLVKTIALTKLGPSFGGIEKTSEGVIAATAQFKLLKETLSGDIDATGVTKLLSRINDLSKKYAVESGNIIEAIKAAGGVFAAGEGLLDQVTGQFTSKDPSVGLDVGSKLSSIVTVIRSQTRLSDSIISTGLRTIIQRLQDAKVNEGLQEVIGGNFSLRDAEGQFIGVYNALKLISEEFRGVSTQSKEFAKAVDLIGGGVRQSKIAIPLIKAFGEIEKAYESTKESTDSITKDAAIAQESLSVKLTKIGQELATFGVKIAESTGFKEFLDTVKDTIKAVTELLDLFKPTLQFGAFAGISSILAPKALSVLGNSLPLARSVPGDRLGSTVLQPAYQGSALQSIMNMLQNKYQPIAPIAPPRRFMYGGSAFAKGGLVDALLTPGEIVIPPDQVKKIGRNNLERINQMGLAGVDSIRTAIPSGSHVLNSNASMSVAGTIKRQPSPMRAKFDKQYSSFLGKMGIFYSPQEAKQSSGVYVPSKNMVGVHPEARQPRVVGLHELVHALGVDVEAARLKNYEQKYGRFLARYAVNKLNNNFNTNIQEGKFFYKHKGSLQSMSADLQRQTGYPNLYKEGAPTAIETSGIRLRDLYRLVKAPGTPEETRTVMREAWAASGTKADFEKELKYTKIGQNILQNRNLVKQALRTRLPGFNQGGFVGTVPGSGNSDSFRASLMPGSYVLNKKSSNMIGSGVMKFSVGGGVPDPYKDPMGFIERRFGKNDIQPATSRSYQSLYESQEYKTAKKQEQYALSQLPRAEKLKEYGKIRIKRGRERLDYWRSMLGSVGTAFRPRLDQEQKRFDKIRSDASKRAEEVRYNRTNLSNARNFQVTSDAQVARAQMSRSIPKSFNEARQFYQEQQSYTGAPNIIVPQRVLGKVGFGASTNFLDALLLQKKSSGKSNFSRFGSGVALNTTNDTNLEARPSFFSRGGQSITGYGLSEKQQGYAVARGIVSDNAVSKKNIKMLGGESSAAKILTSSKKYQETLDKFSASLTKTQQQGLNKYYDGLLLNASKLKINALELSKQREALTRMIAASTDGSKQQRDLIRQRDKLSPRVDTAIKQAQTAESRVAPLMQRMVKIISPEVAAQYKTLRKESRGILKQEATRTELQKLSTGSLDNSQIIINNRSDELRKKIIDDLKKSGTRFKPGVLENYASTIANSTRIQSTAQETYKSRSAGARAEKNIGNLLSADTKKELESLRRQSLLVQPVGQTRRYVKINAGNLDVQQQARYDFLQARVASTDPTANLYERARTASKTIGSQNALVNSATAGLFNRMNTIAPNDPLQVRPNMVNINNNDQLREALKTKTGVEKLISAFPELRKEIQATAKEVAKSEKVTKNAQKAEAKLAEIKKAGTKESAAAIKQESSTSRFRKMSVGGRAMIDAAEKALVSPPQRQSLGSRIGTMGANALVGTGGAIGRAVFGERLNLSRINKDIGSLEQQLQGPLSKKQAAGVENQIQNLRQQKDSIKQQAQERKMQRTRRIGEVGMGLAFLGGSMSMSEDETIAGRGRLLANVGGGMSVGAMFGGPLGAAAGALYGYSTASKDEEVRQGKIARGEMQRQSLGNMERAISSGNFADLQKNLDVFSAASVDQKRLMSIPQLAQPSQIIDMYGANVQSGSRFIGGQQIQQPRTTLGGAYSQGFAQSFRGDNLLEKTSNLATTGLSRLYDQTLGGGFMVAGKTTDDYIADERYAEDKKQRDASNIRTRAYLDQLDIVDQSTSKRITPAMRKLEQTQKKLQSERNRRQNEVSQAYFVGSDNIPRLTKAGRTGGVDLQEAEYIQDQNRIKELEAIQQQGIEETTVKTDTGAEIKTRRVVKPLSKEQQQELDTLRGQVERSGVSERFKKDEKRYQELLAQEEQQRAQLNKNRQAAVDIRSQKEFKNLIESEGGMSDYEAYAAEMRKTSPAMKDSEILKKYMNDPRMKELGQRARTKAERSISVEETISQNQDIYNQGTTKYREGLVNESNRASKYFGALTESNRQNIVNMQDLAASRTAGTVSKFGRATPIAQILSNRVGYDNIQNGGTSASAAAEQRFNRYFGADSTVGRASRESGAYQRLSNNFSGLVQQQQAANPAISVEQAARQALDQFGQQNNLTGTGSFEQVQREFQQLIDSTISTTEEGLDSGLSSGDFQAAIDQIATPLSESVAQAAQALDELTAQQIDAVNQYATQSVANRRANYQRTSGVMQGFYEQFGAMRGDDPVRQAERRARYSRLAVEDLAGTADANAIAERRAQVQKELGATDASDPRFAALTEESVKLTEALKMLSENTDDASVAMAKIEEETRQRDVKRGQLVDLLTGGKEDRESFMRQEQARAALESGNIDYNRLTERDLGDIRGAIERQRAIDPKKAEQLEKNLINSALRPMEQGLTNAYSSGQVDLNKITAEQRGSIRRELERRAKETGKDRALNKFNERIRKQNLEVAEGGITFGGAAVSGLAQTREENLKGREQEVNAALGNQQNAAAAIKSDENAALGDLQNILQGIANSMAGLGNLDFSKINFRPIEDAARTIEKAANTIANASITLNVNQSVATNQEAARNDSVNNTIAMNNDKIRNLINMAMNNFARGNNFIYTNI